MSKISALVFLSLVSTLTSSQASSQVKKTVFVHMANTPGAVRWGLNQGANGVELDLQFSGSSPSYFQHSLGLQPCDCTCICAVGSYCPAESVCKALWKETGSHCKASSSAEAMTKALGGADVRSKLAVIYIDSKLTNSMVDYSGAGAKVVELFNTNVFAQGYLGQVIISGTSTKYADYLKGALAAARASPYESRYFYTFDFEGRNYEQAWAELQRLGTDNIVFSTGITICSGGTYYDAIRASVAKNVYAGVGIWTLDLSSSMQKYIDAGVTSIMTNKPSVAVEMFGGAANIATPGNALVAKSVPKPPPAYFKCDCNYHRGGCTIIKSAPANYACKCIYKYFWTCGGETVECSNANNYYCLNPDGSKQSCKFGGGDCGGY